MPPDRQQELEAAEAERKQLAVRLSVLTLGVYLVFILLVAFQRPLLATQVAPGWSLGIVLGTLMYVLSFVVTGAYVMWANRRFDAVSRA